MPLLNDIHSIAVNAANANFTAHTYTEVYAGADDTIVINGVTFKIGNGSSVKIKVKSVSGGTNCILLGEEIDNRMDSPTLGGTY